jgi:hypothetical protein
LAPATVAVSLGQQGPIAIGPCWFSDCGTFLGSLVFDPRSLPVTSAEAVVAAAVDS